jgi:group I intron endonuclease
MKINKKKKDKVIYKISNIINNKLYIGKDCKNNKNYYGSGKLIILAIKKYGKENFKKEIIEICEDKNILNEREIYWISKLNTITPNGYNISKGGEGSIGMLGKKHKEETKRKMRKSHKGKHIGEKNCMFGKTPWNKGKTNTKESINKFIKTRKENPHTWIYKDKKSKMILVRDLEKYTKEGWNKGHYISIETRIKISNSLKNRKLTEEHKLKISKNNNKSRSVLVLNIETGIFYDSIKSAANTTIYSSSTLRKKLRGIRKNNTSFILI